MFRRALITAVVVLTAAVSSSAQPAASLLDVPYIEQSESLCGGAAAAMVMRYWGARGVYAESFASLVDSAAGGIRADRLARDIAHRGWLVTTFAGDAKSVGGRLSAGQPVVALIEDRPGLFHFVVVVGASNGRIVYHDPARAPYRVADARTFDAAWEKAGRWAMVVVPSGGEPMTSTTSEGEASSPVAPCDALVQRGVAAAHQGSTDDALAILASAADLCGRSSAALREAAGVYALASKWEDAARLARAAVSRDPSDEHAWRILAASEFVRGDSARALAAWNRIGEPTIELVQVSGLDRTRHRAATSAIGLDVDSRLTAAALEAADKRAGELPAAQFARVTYEPAGEGRANVNAVIVERPASPFSWPALATTAVRAAIDRTAAVAVSSVTGGGELIEVGWRWWEHRPRAHLSYAMPSTVGVWRAEVFTERQEYGTDDAARREERTGGTIGVSNWTDTLTRWELGAGFDAWNGNGRTVSLEIGVDQRLDQDRLAVRGGVTGYAGAFNTVSSRMEIDWRSRVRREGRMALARAGVEHTGSAAALALWPGAGTGHGRSALLRGHQLLDDGRISGEMFGRTLYHAGGELQYWVRPVRRIVRIAPAAFVDLARASHRLEPGSVWHVDAGLGVRVSLPGTGVLRVDVGRGLRDGATAFSVGWER